MFRVCVSLRGPACAVALSRAVSGTGDAAPSDVPDVLAPRLKAVFCGINPGRVSAAAQAHFANPRNDFWRLLHDAGLTPRLLAPEEQFDLPRYGYGLTNAAYRTTPGSGDLRRADFDLGRLARLADELAPRAIAFVGKEAYRGLFGERPDLGPQQRTLDGTGLFVLPSTSPANAAVPYAERLRWFERLRDWLEPMDRPAARALVLGPDDRILLVRFAPAHAPEGWWATPGGALDAGETHEEALSRELLEEAGITATIGACVWTRVHEFAWAGRLVRQRERYYVVRVESDEVAPQLDLAAEDVQEIRWWTLVELEASEDVFAPRRLAALVRDLLTSGPPPEPVDAGV